MHTILQQTVIFSTIELCNLVAKSGYQILGGLI